MSKLLAIETSTEACSVAISIDGVVHERFELAAREHAELLLPMVSELLTNLDLDLKAMDAIAFGRGPGSFTSLRIGIGVVQGLAWGAGLPVIPVSSLAAVAQTALEQGLDADVERIFVAVDARMQEVYCAQFDIGLNGLVTSASAEQVVPPTAIRISNPRRICGAGNGYSSYPELLHQGAELAQCLPQCWPRAVAVCHLAEAWLEHRDPLPAAQAQPVYIRDKVAEKPGQK